MQRETLLAHLEQLLSANAIRDYCPNGLQVAGRQRIEKIVTGVTASQALIDAAIATGADTLLVHHGYFWKGENPTITGLKRRRLGALMTHDINLIAYHLPLDVHPTLGNNAQLAKQLDIEITGPLGDEPYSVVMGGKLARPLSATDFAARVENALGRKVLLEQVGDSQIETIGWCTGGGQGYIDLAAERGVDAYLTGEVSEQTIHSAREQGVHFISAGHHATERYGVKALGEHLADQFGVNVDFIDIDNPA